MALLRRRMRKVSIRKRDTSGRYSSVQGASGRFRVKKVSLKGLRNNKNTVNWKARNRAQEAMAKSDRGRKAKRRRQQALGLATVARRRKARREQPRRR